MVYHTSNSSPKCRGLAKKRSYVQNIIYMYSIYRHRVCVCVWIWKDSYLPEKADFPGQWWSRKYYYMKYECIWYDAESSQYSCKALRWNFKWMLTVQVFAHEVPVEAWSGPDSSAVSSLGKSLMHTGTWDGGKEVTNRGPSSANCMCEKANDPPNCSLLFGDAAWKNEDWRTRKTWMRTSRYSFIAVVSKGDFHFGQTSALGHTLCSFLQHYTSCQHPSSSNLQRHSGLEVQRGNC